MYILLIVIALLILFLTVVAPSNSHNKHSIVGILFVLIVLLMGAFRDTTIGTDIGLGSGYHTYWQNPAGWDRDLEPGFELLTYFIKSISNSYHFYYSLIYILNIFFYYLACRKLRIEFPLFMAVLYLAGLLTPSFNVIRQMLGLSIGLFIYGATYFDKSKNIRNVILYEMAMLTCGLLIHRSVLLLCFVPLFDISYVSNLFTKSWFLIIFAALGVILSQYGVTQILQNLLHFQGAFGERADVFIEIAENYDIDRSHGFITDAINFVLFIVISKDIRNSFFKIGILGYALSCLAAAALGTIGRAFDNLVIFACLYYAQNWKAFITTSKFKMIPISTMMLRIVFWLTSLYYTVLQNESICPYKSFLF